MRIRTWFIALIIALITATALGTIKPDTANHSTTKESTTR